MAFRNGPIENIHAGHSSCSMCGASHSRISDQEMREIMKFAVDRAATLMMLRENNVDQYEKLVMRALDYVQRWDDPVLVQGYLSVARGSFGQ